jgi:ketosteroid isomerase-like protein
MSQQDVDVVRDQFQAVNERDWARAMGHYAEDVVLVVTSSFGLQIGTFEGKERVGDWFGDWFGTFDRDYHFDIQEAIELEDGLVYVHAAHGGRGRLSGAEVSDETFYLYRVSDRRVARVELFGTREEALAAAGAGE